MKSIIAYLKLFIFNLICELSVIVRIKIRKRKTTIKRLVSLQVVLALTNPDYAKERELNRIKKFESQIRKSEDPLDKMNISKLNFIF